MTPELKKALMWEMMNEQQQQGGGYPPQQYPAQMPMPMNSMGNAYPMGQGYPGQMPMPGMGGGKDIEIPVKLVPSFGAATPQFPMFPPPPQEPKPAPKSGIGFVDVAMILLILFCFMVFLMASMDTGMGGL